MQMIFVKINQHIPTHLHNYFIPKIWYIHDECYCQIEKDAALRRFERTHSQTSLDISMDSEQKATKTLDKLQMVRRAIHGVEQTLESEEERLEKLRQKRFINPLHDITEVSVRPSVYFLTSSLI